MQTGTFSIQKSDGRVEAFNPQLILDRLAQLSLNINHVNIEEITQIVQRALYDGVTTAEIDELTIKELTTKIEQAPEYGVLASHYQYDVLRRMIRKNLNLDKGVSLEEEFVTYIQMGVDQGLLDGGVTGRYDLRSLAMSIDYSRNQNFTYLGLTTLMDRYLIRNRDRLIIEDPQHMFMRVAMGLAQNEEDKHHWAIEFYNLLSSFDYMSSTPTLFNSCTMHPQLSSCYLTTIPDDLYGIYGALRDNAMLSKFAGGLGNDWTPVRALGSMIKGTNGPTQGTIPFLKVANDTAVAVNQGSRRKGAVCAYLETWHLDIEEFLDLRKNTGDERRRTHDMNTANWIPDLFMVRVLQEEMWTLFSPSDVPELHDAYGKTFEQLYLQAEAKTHTGEIKHFRRVKAVDLWRKMLSMLFETGHPWLTFKDPCNIRSPQDHVGVVHSSNLCCEITLNTSADEIAVCNLGSINMVSHVDESGELLIDKLSNTVEVAIRMLDNVIDQNYYPVPQSKTSNMRHRPIGLGIMGFQDALYKARVSYASQRAVELADWWMENVGYLAIEASCKLAKERGAYESYKGSKWDRGMLPIDTIDLLAQARPEGMLKQDTNTRLGEEKWSSLRAKIAEFGMRNSNVMAIAPTATISNICGVSQSIEPQFQNLFVKSNLSGEFTIINEWLVRDLRNLGLWDVSTMNALKASDGSVQNIGWVPQDLKDLYRTAFEVEPRYLVEAASRRQKWIDQAQSLNLYIVEPNGRKLDVTYKMAWLSGLKTTYYLRAMSATQTEKSTVTTGDLNAVSAVVPTAPMACSIDNPDCEACQ